MRNSIIVGNQLDCLMILESGELAYAFNAIKQRPNYPEISIKNVGFV